MNERYMSAWRVKGILSQIGVLIENGHFVYTLGGHASTYFNKDALLSWPEKASFLCEVMAMECRQPADVVIGPAVAGTIFAFEVARHMSFLRSHEVRFGYAEKDAPTGKMMLKRGYKELVHEKTVLVVEDVLTTGGTARGIIDAVRSAGGAIVGVAAVCNRGGVTKKDLNIEDAGTFFSLIDMNLDMWDAKECPLCATNVPIDTRFGHGAEFLAHKKS